MNSKCVLNFEISGASFFNAAKKGTPLLWRIYLYEKCLLILHYEYQSLSLYYCSSAHQTTKYSQGRCW